MTGDPIYLDHNATTPVLPEVVDAMLPFLRTHFGNPSSAHVHGSRARAAIDRARAKVAALLGCDADEVTFTSGGTEANNLAIRGVAARSTRRHVVTSNVEHPATERPVELLEQRGWRVARLPVDEDGRVTPSALDAAVSPQTALVTLMHSNNETGVLQPVAAAASAARRVGALVHTDAAQSIGKVPIDVRSLDVDLLSIAGHKLYAPKGVGALFVRRGTPIAPVLVGAGHEHGLRPGTENVASIVGLGAACAAAQRDLEGEAARVRGLRDALLARLSAAVPGLTLNGHRDDRLPNTLNVRFPGVSGNALLSATPEIAASTGSACHDGHDRASAVILAMGVPAADAIGSVRLTLGRGTTREDIERAASTLGRAWHGQCAGSRS